MTPIRLKRLVTKPEVKEILNALSTASVAIQDLEGQVIWGSSAASLTYPIQIAGDPIGYVIGEGSTIATILSYIAARELEKKTLAQETLDHAAAQSL
jgi:hypothetical protein